MNSVIQRAIELCGNQHRLAKECNVSQPAVALWLKGRGIMAKHVPLISKATNGEITVEEICHSCLELSMQKEKRNGTQ